MLTILGGGGEQFCDGFSRRTFLQIGGLALGGLSIPQLLQAESASGTRRSQHKAVIMIYLPGGPPHQDTFDLKPDAPSEIRGPFNPIKTSARGIEICELLPRIAAIMDKLVVLRSVVGSVGFHTGFQCMTGREFENQPQGRWPFIGSVLSYLQGQVHPSMPSAINLAPRMRHLAYNFGTEPGFLGPAHSPFVPADERIKADMLLQGITMDRLRDRKSLLKSFDKFRRATDNSGLMDSLDTFHQQAFGILTSGRMAEAFDLSKEDSNLRDRYGRGSAAPAADAGPRHLDQFLLARRLVEAGARCVTLAFSFWDWHGSNFVHARDELPLLDQGVSALVQDLHDRGLDQDVSVVVWGEFGRTPKINKRAGRDHWPKVSCGLLAGGGMRTGQVVGATERDAGDVKERPVHFQEVFATLYHNMGIDVHTATVPDLTGRPRHLVDSQYKPIPEVI